MAGPNRLCFRLYGINEGEIQVKATKPMDSRSQLHASQPHLPGALLGQRTQKWPCHAFLSRCAVCGRCQCWVCMTRRCVCVMCARASAYCRVSMRECADYESLVRVWVRLGECNRVCDNVRVLCYATKYLHYADLSFLLSPRALCTMH